MNYEIITEAVGIIAKFEYEFDRDMCLETFRENFPDVTFTTNDKG